MHNGNDRLSSRFNDVIGKIDAESLHRHNGELESLLGPIFRNYSLARRLITAEDGNNLEVELNHMLPQMDRTLNLCADGLGKVQALSSEVLDIAGFGTFWDTFSSEIAQVVEIFPSLYYEFQIFRDAGLDRSWFERFTEVVVQARADIVGDIAAEGGFLSYLEHNTRRAQDLVVEVKSDMPLGTPLDEKREWLRRAIVRCGNALGVIGGGGVVGGDIAGAISGNN